MWDPLKCVVVAPDGTYDWCQREPPSVTDTNYIDLVSIIERCRAGANSAWNEFDEWFKDKAGRILGRYRLGEGRLEEVRARCRENIFKAIQSGAIRGQTSGEIAAYIATAVKHEALDACAERQGEELPTDVLDPMSNPERNAIARIDLERAEGIIQSWPANDRFLFIEKIQGVSASTIREELMRHFGEGIAVATVDSRFSKLRQGLREALGRSDHDETAPRAPR